jgi:aminopeptidase N
MDRRRAAFAISFLLLVQFLDGCEPGAPDPQPGADGIGDAYAPQSGNGGYDVQSYDLDLAWDHVTCVLSGTAAIGAIATMDLSRLNLDFYGFEVREVTVNEAPSTFSRDGQELTITLPKAIHAEQPFTVTLGYRGVPELWHDRIGGVTSGWLAEEGTVAVPPFSSAGWFPSNDHPRDKALFNLHLTVPKPLDVVASGTLVKTIDNGDTATFVWRTAEVVFMPTVAIDDFDSRAVKGPHGLPVDVHYRAGNGEAKDAAEQADVLGDILTFFSERFGPFPFEAYHLVLHDTMSEVAFSLHTTSVIRRDPVRRQCVGPRTGAPMFANSVSPYSLGDMWLVEGFATYAEALWVKHTTGEDMLVSHYDLIRTMGPPGTPPVDNVYDHSIYGRGAWTLKALHMKLGDDLFFEQVRAYTDRYRHGVASTDDFIALAKKVSGDDLGKFFDEWLYGEVMPSVPGLGAEE